MTSEARLLSFVVVGEGGTGDGVGVAPGEGVGGAGEGEGDGEGDVLEEGFSLRLPNNLEIPDLQGNHKNSIKLKTILPFLASGY